MPLRRAVALGAVVGLLALAGCGGSEGRASLAVDGARRDGRLVIVTTECADHLAVEVRPDPAGSGLVEVSLWGRPRLGRCQASTAVDGIPADQPKLVDAATGQVVDIDAG